MYINKYGPWKQLVTEQSKPKVKKLTLNDIWRGYGTLDFGDRQLSSDSALATVQQQIINEIGQDKATKLKFKPDNDFGKTTAKALGLALTGKEYTNPNNVKIGPKTLAALGLDPPKDYPLNTAMLATTLVVESGDKGKNEMIAIANVIANRQSAINNYRKNVIKTGGPLKITDVVLRKNQFSLWNAHQGKTRENMKSDAMKRWRPENSKYWSYAVRLANNLLAGTGLVDNTKGATHYYNPSIVVPIWGKGKSEKWVSHNLKLTHEFGRDTSVNWAKMPIKRS